MSNNIKVHVISFVEKQSFFPVEIGVRLFELEIRWVRSCGDGKIIQGSERELKVAKQGEKEEANTS